MRRFLLLGLTITCGLLGVLTSPRARAAGPRPRVAVVGLKFSAGLPEAARDALSNKLRDGLMASGFDVQSAGSSAGRQCSAPSCWSALADALDVRYLVTGSIQERQKTYDVELQLIDGHTGKLHSSTPQHCDICGLEEAGEKLALAAGTLAARLSTLVKEPALLQVRSSPSRAAVTIDGKLAGLTPLEVKVSEGPHTVLVEAPGYRPAERTMNGVMGVVENMDLTLSKNVSPFPYKAAGWTAVGVGVATIAAGLFLLDLHGSKVSCPVREMDNNGNCPYLLGTDWWAAGVVGVGSALTTLGGVWLYLGREEDTGNERRASTGGYTMGVRGVF